MEKKQEAKIKIKVARRRNTFFLVMLALLGIAAVFNAIAGHYIAAITNVLWVYIAWQYNKVRSLLLETAYVLLKTGEVIIEMDNELEHKDAEIAELKSRIATFEGHTDKELAEQQENGKESE